MRAKAGEVDGRMRRVFADDGMPCFSTGALLQFALLANR